LEGSSYRRSRHRRLSLEPRKKAVPDSIHTYLVGAHMLVKLLKLLEIDKEHLRTKLN